MSWVWQSAGGSGGGGGVKEPALQPTDFSPRAQWALNERTPVAADRSGNGLGLVAGTPITAVCPDLIPNAVAQALSGRQRAAGNALLAIAGELTVTCRVWAYEDVNEQVIAQHLNGAGTQNFWGIGMNALSRRPYFGWNNGGAFVGPVLGADLVLGRWYFLSFRRLASGVAVMGVNTSFEASGPYALCTAAGSGLVTVGCRSTLLSTTEWEGGLADVCVWASALSDAQVLSLYGVAMGRFA